MIGLFSALAMILHIFDFPVLFLAPGFYKLDYPFSSFSFPA